MEYPKIAAQAKEEGAEIQWGETGLRSDDVCGRGYAPKGKTPVVLANANRSKLSLISTVSNKGQVRWKILSGALGAKVLIGFMKPARSNASLFHVDQLGRMRDGEWNAMPNLKTRVAFQAARFRQRFRRVESARYGRQQGPVAQRLEQGIHNRE